MPPSEVVAALTRAEALLKAMRPLLKARRIDWHRVNHVLTMAREELNEPAATILDWELDRYRDDGLLPRGAGE